MKFKKISLEASATLIRQYSPFISFPSSIPQRKTLLSSSHKYQNQKPHEIEANAGTLSRHSLGNTKTMSEGLEHQHSEREVKDQMRGLWDGASFSLAPPMDGLSYSSMYTRLWGSAQITSESSCLPTAWSHFHVQGGWQRRGEQRGDWASPQQPILIMASTQAQALYLKWLQDSNVGLSCYSSTASGSLCFIKSSAQHTHAVLMGGLRAFSHLVPFSH